jgi:hypothetical protein
MNQTHLRRAYPAPKRQGPEGRGTQCGGGCPVSGAPTSTARRADGWPELAMTCGARSRWARRGRGPVPRYRTTRTTFLSQAPGRSRVRAGSRVPPPHLPAVLDPSRSSGPGAPVERGQGPFTRGPARGGAAAEPANAGPGSRPTVPREREHEVSGVDRDATPGTHRYPGRERPEQKPRQKPVSSQREVSQEIHIGGSPPRGAVLNRCM